MVGWGWVFFFLTLKATKRQVTAHVTLKSNLTQINLIICYATELFFALQLIYIYILISPSEEIFQVVHSCAFRLREFELEVDICIKKTRTESRKSIFCSYRDGTYVYITLLSFISLILEYAYL